VAARRSAPAAICSEEPSWGVGSWGVKSLNWIGLLEGAVAHLVWRKWLRELVHGTTPEAFRLLWRVLARVLSPG
jgi:hypothetical protein